MYAFPPNQGSLGGEEHEPRIFLAWPCNKTFSAPNSDSLGLFGLWAHKLVNLRSVTSSSLWLFFFFSFLVMSFDEVLNYN